jgi:hypothetical protein
MVEGQNGNLTKWQVDEMAGRLYGRLMKWHVDEMASWPNNRKPQ